MDYQAQGLVLVNNEWVSRPLDIYQILARAQQADTEMQEPISKPADQAVEVGILSRTLFASPMYTHVLSANILHREITNVVMIGENSVHLKEMVDVGQLGHIATKTDFDGRIRAARVFGDPRKESALLGLDDVWSINQSLSQDNTLPPEVVVLTLTSRTLMFLWACSEPTGSVKFKQRTIRLPASTSQFSTFGAHLAVDPKRRAMAVAAHEGRFILYKTKSMEMWRKETAQGNETTPIEDERVISIEGRIIHMEFLSSGFGNDDFHVVLLFIVAHHGKTKITCFDWDCRHDLSKAFARTERVAVDFEDHNPSLLIPLEHNLDFLLVFDTHISVYKDVLSGVPVRNQVDVPSKFCSTDYPGDSKGRPRWVAWDRGRRDMQFAHTIFYIAREDGRVMSLQQDEPGSIEILAAGDLPARIDTAFACLSADIAGNDPFLLDFLIAGGAGRDSLLFNLADWPNRDAHALQDPELYHLAIFESIPNWSPLSDLCIKQVPSSHAPYEQKSATIFVTNGISPQGEISELRSGLSAPIDDFFSGVNGCTGLWIYGYASHLLTDGNEILTRHNVSFIMNLPLESILIEVYCLQPQIRGEASDTWLTGQWHKRQVPPADTPKLDGILRDYETLSACRWSEDLSIQITKRGLRTFGWSPLGPIDTIKFNHDLLMAACSPKFPLIAYAHHDSDGIFVDLVRIFENGKFDNNSIIRIVMTSDPTCIELFDIDGVYYVFVSSFDSIFFLLRVDPSSDSSNISKVLSGSFKGFQFTDSPMLCESAAILTSKGRKILVCTTRNGFLLHIELGFPLDTGTTEVTRKSKWRSIKMGVTSVRISHCRTDPAAAFVSCGPNLCRVRCSKEEAFDLEIDSVWFTHSNNFSYSQAAVTAMCQIPFQVDPIGKDLGGFLFAVSGDQVLFSKLDSDVITTHRGIASMPSIDSAPVPRKLSTIAKPTKMLYLEPLKKIIVSTIEAKEAKGPPNGYRVLHSTLKLLNVYDETPLDEPEVKLEDGDMSVEKLWVAQYDLKHGERVYSIVEWPFVDHQGKKYSLVIVGTGLQIAPGREMGRRLIFNTGKLGTRLQLQKDSAYEHPVYCITVWSNESTVSVVGKSLSFDCFDSQAGRWFKRGKTDLPSPALHISAKPPFVYVSTLQHSHICYELVPASSEGRFEFVQVFTDSRERSCTHHLVLDLPKEGQDEGQTDRIVLFTDKKSASLTGLYQPPDRTYKNAADTVFEACLPRTVIRLQQGDIRPPWRRSARSSKINGVVTDDIVGACSDGTLYSFSILSNPALHLLRLVQNLILAKRARDPALQDTLVKHKQRRSDIFDVLMSGAEETATTTTTSEDDDDKITARSVDPRMHEHGAAGPRKKHVDGDVIVRWMDDGGDLQSLICKGTEEYVQTLFAVLMKEVESKWVVVSGDDEVELMLEMVRRWIFQVLRPVL